MSSIVIASSPIAAAIVSRHMTEAGDHQAI